jgi:hypothetical protein
MRRGEARGDGRRGDPVPTRRPRVRRRWAAWLAAAVLGAGLALGVSAAQAQLDRAAPGVLGLDADPGLTSGVARLFDLGGLGDGWAAAEARAAPVPHLTYWPAAVFGPSARIRLGDAPGDPRADLIRHALGEPAVHVQPATLRLGLRRIDLMAAYSFYGTYRDGDHMDALGGAWTNELATGGTIYLDRARAWRLSALASYDVDGRRAGSDGARAATVRIHGGARIRLGRLVDVGAGGYAIRLVNDERSGADPPPPASRARQRVFGAGPEVDVAVPSLSARVGFRYERDYVAQSQATADAFVLSLTFVGWGG